MSPIDYKKYGPHWPETRSRIMARAGEVRACEWPRRPRQRKVDPGVILEEARCEKCGVTNHSFVHRVGGTAIYCSDRLIATGYKSCDLCRKNKGFTRVVLTVAHLDHDARNWKVKDDRLAAWCQQCHLDYDRHIHVGNRQRNIDREAGQDYLFAQKMKLPPSE